MKMNTYFKIGVVVYTLLAIGWLGLALFTVQLHGWQAFSYIAIPYTPLSVVYGMLSYSHLQLLLLEKEREEK